MNNNKTNQLTTPDAALLYCRVSSQKQDDDGSGLTSQEHRCREKAAQLGLNVEAIFPDIVSGEGNFMKRPGMVQLLAHLDANPHKRYVVIFDDLKRYSRDTEFHLNLRRQMLKRNAIRICLNFQFQDSPEGKFYETIVAATGTLEREQNARQVLQKMTARLQQGYWVFHAPKGYTYVDGKIGGREMVIHEPVASVVREAFEGYACGRFESQSEVRNYLQDHPHFPKNSTNYLLQQRVTDMLTNPLYAGYIVHERYGINWVKAKHEPIISLETFEKVQERRQTGTKAPARKNLNEDFPLRGFVLCDDCNKPLTSCWSKGKSKKYPYYLCDTRGCKSYRKSIRRDQIEGEFEGIVQSLQPREQLYDLARAMFKNAWQQRKDQVKARLNAMQTEVQSVEKEINRMLDRIVDVSSTSVLRTFERKIESLEKQKVVLEDKLAQKPEETTLDEKFIEPALSFLANPWNLWASGHYAWKRMVLRLAFSERLAYHRYEGYRTPKTALPFKVLEDFRLGKSDLVRSRRLELPRVLPHSDLNAARLPIPPRPHIRLFPEAVSVEAPRVAKGIWARKSRCRNNSQAHEFSSRRGYNGPSIRIGLISGGRIKTSVIEIPIRSPSSTTCPRATSVLLA